MLALYSTLGAAEISSGGTYTNPLVITTDLSATTVTQQLWLQSDSTTSENFSNIVIWCQDSGATDESSWFQFADDNNGAPGTYYGKLYSTKTCTYGSSVPIWVQFTQPAQTQAGSLSRFSIQVIGTKS